jgi:acetaldehyde dehydrogenase
MMRCAILGSGNIGSDLTAKVLRSPKLQLTAVIGIDGDSAGLARAKDAGVDVSADGVKWLSAHPDAAELVFDATSAAAHSSNMACLLSLGMRCLDLTPSKHGPGVVPVVNLTAHRDAVDINLISCGGQATIPIVAAVRRSGRIPYAEIVSTVASCSAGPGTRQNIDEFTRSTAAGLMDVGGAERGKAIIILNPADPPILMRNTVFCELPVDSERASIAEQITKMAERVRDYVPGYRLRSEPIFDESSVAVVIEVEGAGDYLPSYAGNLDIMTAAAVRVAEDLATAPRQCRSPRS